MPIIIVKPLSDDTDTDRLMRSLTPVAHEGYTFVLIPNKVDVNLVTKAELHKMIDDIKEE